MITVGMYCEVEYHAKFSEPYWVYLLGDSGRPFEFETRQQAETFLLNHGVSPTDMKHYLFFGGYEKV